MSNGLSEAERAAEHLWLGGVRRDPRGEVRFYPSTPGHGMSGTYAGQVTDSIDDMLAAARQAGREEVVARVEAMADGWHDRAERLRPWKSEGDHGKWVAYLAAWNEASALVAEFRAPDATSEARP